jgi:hypothetical protein
MKSLKPKPEMFKKEHLNISKILATLIIASICLFFWVKIMFL